MKKHDIYSYKNNIHYKTQGNVIFIILIAVALFGALSFAVTDTLQGSNTSRITKQAAKASAAAVIKYATDIEQAVTRLQMVNFCSDEQISFENSLFKRNNGTVFQPDGHNPNAPADNSCDVFHGNGGAVPLGLAPKEVIDSSTPSSDSFASHRNVMLVNPSIINVGSSENELALIVPHMNPDVCRAINKMLALPSPDDMPSDTHGGLSYGGIFNGSYNSGSVLGDTATGVQGHFMFCVKHSNLIYHYYHVIIAR